MKTKHFLAAVAALAGLCLATAQNTSYNLNTTPVNGVNCSAFGTQALNANTSAGASNTGIGYTALFNNSGASNNTALGAGSMFSNVFGEDNTAGGYRALYSCQYSNYNTAFGCEALFSSTVDCNSGFGRRALYTNRWGGFNTAMGFNTALNNLSGSRLVAIGANALATNVYEYDNTAVGYNADINAAGIINASAIGSGAIVTGANVVQLGDVNVARVETQTGLYTSTSDGRFKTNIKEDDVKGLAFIMRLRPVAYNFDSRKLQEFITKNFSEELRKQHLSKDFSKSSAIRHNGFIAQEVEQAAKELNYYFDGVIAPETDQDKYSIAYAQFVVPLVKAVQEQQKMIEDLQKQLAARPEVNTTGINDQSLTDGFTMAQNVPNPFTHETVIR